VPATEGRPGVYEQLVGEGGEGREHARAAHHDAVGGVGDLVEGDLVTRTRHVAPCLVDGGLHDGVGEREITPRRLLLEGHEILRPAIVAVGSPFVGAAREAGERHVEIVGGATHDAHAELGEALQTGVAALEVGAGARNDVADIDRLARLGIRHETDRGRLVLQVEQPSHGACRPAKAGCVAMSRTRSAPTHTWRSSLSPCRNSLPMRAGMASDLRPRPPRPRAR
jgi:hypothetical protein